MHYARWNTTPNQNDRQVVAYDHDPFFRLDHKMMNLNRQLGDAHRHLEMQKYPNVFTVLAFVSTDLSSDKIATMSPTLQCVHFPVTVPESVGIHSPYSLGWSRVHLRVIVQHRELALEPNVARDVVGDAPSLPSRFEYSRLGFIPNERNVLLEHKGSLQQIHREWHCTAGASRR